MQELFQLITMLDSPYIGINRMFV